MEARAAEEGARAPCEAWLAVSEGLLSGVHHSLNNRLASLSALAQLLALGDAPSPDTERALLEEVRRMEESLLLLRLLPRSPGAAPLPLQLPELLSDALALLAHHRELRAVGYTVEGEPGVLPTVAEESTALQALLVLLAGVGEAALRSGEGRVRVRYGGDEVRIWLEALAEGALPREVSGVPAATEMARAAGGEVETVPGGIRFVLPTLPEVRRRERGG